MEFTVHRLYCSHCKTRELEHIPFLSHPKARITKSLERTILEMRQFASVQDIAKYFRLRWHAIKELEKMHLRKRFSRIQTAHIKAIGIDEIHVGNGKAGDQYLTIIRDLESGAVVNVGDGKGVAALDGALKKLKKSKLRVVTMDMANAYYSWISEHFPKVSIVFDHSHVINYIIKEKMRRPRQGDASLTRVIWNGDVSKKWRKSGLKVVFKI